MNASSRKLLGTLAARHVYSTLRRYAALVLLAMVGLAGTTPAYAAMQPSDRDVLMDLYNNTGGATWHNNTGWLGPPGTECGWFGVTCNSAGVRRIQLPQNNLVGSLPISLAGMTNLYIFDVSDNQLTGSIPPLAELTDLDDFRVYNNQLTGSIPSLAGLTNLGTLLAYGNDLTGTIPSLAGLTNLEYFWVDHNHLVGAIPSLGGLTSLSHFNVSHNQLTGTIPPLVGLTNLSQFSVTENHLTGTIPSLTGLVQLEDFRVARNQLTGTIPSLAGLSSLKIFYVYDNQLRGNAPDVPSPTVLQPESSSLCPNLLNRTPSFAWDVATGQTPWYQSCSGLFGDGFEID